MIETLHRESILYVLHLHGCWYMVIQAEILNLTKNYENLFT